jgi:hypothetical protein
MKLPNWPALLLAPSLALTNLSVTYALVSPSCALQTTLALNAVAALILLACAAFTWAAWRNWRQARLPYGGPADNEENAQEDAAGQRPSFMALVSWPVGALSCLVVLAQWFPQWVLSPCAA